MILLKRFESDFSKWILASYTENNQSDKNSRYCNKPIITAILKSAMHSGIIKTNIFYLFPIFTILENCSKSNKANEYKKITKCDFNNKNIKSFQFLSQNIKWHRSSNSPKKHTIIFKRCILTFTILLPQKEIEIKIKNVNTPWMTKGFREYSKRKQYLYEKLMKMQIAKDEKT